MGSNGELVIDSANSLGAAGSLLPANSTILVQPGTASVTLPGAITLVANDSPTFNTPSGTTLTVQGVISNIGTNTLTKTGIGTLDLTAQSPAAVATGSLTVAAGNLTLDAATAGGTVWGATGLGLVLGAASGTFSNGGTLEITGAFTQGFGTVTVNARANTIQLDGNTALTLGAVTRAAVGGTINFNVGSSGVTSIASTTASLSGLVSGAATWTDNTGVNWAAASGTAITKFTAYNALTGTPTVPTLTSTAAANYIIDSTTTNNVTLATAATISANTLKFSDTNARTIDVRNGSTQETLLLGAGSTTTGVTEAGGILVAPGAGALTIGVAGTPGTLTVGSSTANSTGDLIFINDSSNDVTVNSVIALHGTGAPPVVISGTGSGRVILAGNNTDTGALIINSGVLSVATVNVAATAGPLGQSAVGVGNILLNGGTLQYTNSASSGVTTITDHGITVNAPSTLEVTNSAGVLTLTSTLNGMAGTNAQNVVLNAGILKKTGLGTLDLKDAATNATNANLSIEVSAGTLLLDKTTTSAISAVDLAGGAALIIDAAGTARIAGYGRQPDLRPEFCRRQGERRRARPHRE